MVFSGIVEGTGKIITVSKLENLTKISIKTPQKFSDGIKIGASVCVDGVCLTVSSLAIMTINSSPFSLAAFKKCACPE